MHYFPCCFSERCVVLVADISHITFVLSDSNLKKLKYSSLLVGALKHLLEFALKGLCFTTLREYRKCCLAFYVTVGVSCFVFQ